MTVRKLRLTVPFHADESPASFLARLAARNGTMSLFFATDFGFRMQAVVDGDEAALRTLAILGGVEPDRLLANSFSKSGPLQWLHRGQILHRSALRRANVTVCPACALADIAAFPSTVPHAAVYGRTAWLLDVVRICPVHRIVLVSANQAQGNPRLHDFAQHVKHIIPRLADLAAAPPQDPGPLQEYAMRRFEGSGGSPLLDPMNLASAIRLCETTGALALFGPKVGLKKLNETQLRATGAAGFEAIAGGTKALRTFLDKTQDTAGRRFRCDGARVVFGKLHDLLRRTRDDPEFEIARQIVRDYVIESFPIGSGTELFGKVVGTRKLHSIQTLAKKARVHPKVLRRHLHAAGLVTDAQMGMSDNNVLVEARPGMAVAAPLAEALSLAEAMEHLNAPRAQMAVLRKAGFVRPRHRASGSGGQDRYAVADLDAFLAKLGALGHPRYLRKGSRNIPAAAKQCCRSAADLVRLILDGKLAVRKASGARGYLSVFVDSAEATEALNRSENGGASVGPDTDGLPLRPTARRIATSETAVAALIAHGHLASFVVTHPVNGCRKTLIAADEIGRFQAAYGSLWALSKEHRLHIASMKTALDVAGVEPAFDPATVGARFYNRAEVHEAKLIANKSR